MEDFRHAFRGGYRKRAFVVQYNLILLFGAAAFSAASASWVPLLVGLGVEVVWLLTAPLFSAFRRWVDAGRDDDLGSRHESFASSRASARAAAAPAPSSARPVPLVVSRSSISPVAVSQPSSQPGQAPSVDAEYRERVKRLGASLREIHTLADEELRKVRSEELTAALGTLSELAAAFERLCKLHQRLKRYVAQTSRADLEQELARLNEGFSKEKDLGLRVTLRQAVTLAQRRLEQHGRICSLERATELRLDMIDSAASHVRSQGLTMTSPDEFAAQIRDLFTHVASVNALEQDSAEAPASRRTSALPPVTPAAAGER